MMDIPFQLMLIFRNHSNTATNRCASSTWKFITSGTNPSQMYHRIIRICYSNFTTSRPCISYAQKDVFWTLLTSSLSLRIFLTDNQLCISFSHCLFLLYISKSGGISQEGKMNRVKTQTLDTQNVTVVLLGCEVSCLHIF